MAAVQKNRDCSQAVLLQEMNHRMANTLAWASARLRVDLRQPGSLDIGGILARHERLLADFGALHRCLAVGATGEMISLSDYFPVFCELLCRTVLAPVRAYCELSVAEIQLDADICEKLAMIVAELVMNAAKHAFRGGAGGVVKITIEAGDGTIVCRVSDNGCGGAASAVGLGTRILSTLLAQLDGKMAVQAMPSGTQHIIVLPQSAAVSFQS